MFDEPVQPASRLPTHLRKSPKWLILGTLLLILPAALAHLLTAPDDAWQTSLLTLDIYTAAIVILHWTVVLTVAIAAFIVMVMKGPAYVADAYPMNERDDTERSPRQDALY
jgi:hypothetical protein